MKKKLQKILLAAPAFVIAVSCAKEIVPDGTKPVPEPEKVFTAEFESVTKTALNENRTPVWMDGDAIGVTTADDENVRCELIDASKGTFNAGDIIGGAPFMAVYPYAEENTFSGDVLTAAVPSEQKLVSGRNVAPGALVTACKSNSSKLQFRNCVSLIEISIPRTDIAKVTIEAAGDNEKLTGGFTMDLSASPLTPVAAEGAESYATLLPEGETFGPGTYYIAVIPGEIKKFSLVFTNASGEQVSISKDAAVSFGRSTGVNLGSFFTYEIDTAADLIKWAKQRAKYTAWDVVNLNADIALTAEEAKQYVPPTDFFGLFDGRNHRISGLDCPLFCNLQSAEVKDLEVEANISSNGSTNDAKVKNDYGMGILAQYVYPLNHSTAAVRPDPQVNNVKTYGSIEIDGLNAAHHYNAGGIAGATNGVPFNNCENHASVTFKSGTISKENFRIGGIVGTTQTAATASLTACKNYGDVTVAQHPGVSFYAGGILGYNNYQKAAYKDCENHGAVIASETITVSGSYMIAGICANSSGDPQFTNCRNYGEIKSLAKNAKYVYVGGLVGSLRSDNSVISDSENNGILSFSTVAANRVDLGGIVGMTGDTGTEGGYLLQNVTNRGDINITGTAANSASEDFRIGGLIGNMSKGGKIGYNAAYEQVPCYNYGNITVNSAQKKLIRIGGACGSATTKAASLHNVHNRGDISLAITGGTTCVQAQVSGIIGYAGTVASDIENCSSKSDISQSGTVTTKEFACVLGSTNKSGNSIKNCGVGGHLLGTEITSENMDTAVYSSTIGDYVTVTGTYLCE